MTNVGVADVQSLSNQAGKQVTRVVTMQVTTKLLLKLLCTKLLKLVTKLLHCYLEMADVGVADVLSLHEPMYCSETQGADVLHI